MNAPFTPDEVVRALGDRGTTGNSYYEHATDLSHDDLFTLAGITMAGPGLGRRVRERFIAIAAVIMRKHGLRAFEMPKRAAAIHEAGHVVINCVVGVRTTSVLIDHIHRNGELFWIGHTDAPDLAFVDAPTAPAGFDKLLMKARTTYAGIAAEELFAGPDRREGSSLDEIIMSQIFAERAASLIGAEPEALWQNDVWAWCMAELHHNRKAHAEIAAALMERKRLKGKALRDLCRKAKPLSSPDEHWPDIHDHTVQLEDAAPRFGGLHMTMDPRIDLHDNVAWGPNGGRASDVPPTGKGSNPFEQEETETAKAPVVYEIVRFTKEGGPLTKKISLNDDGSTSGSRLTFESGRGFPGT